MKEFILKEIVTEDIPSELKKIGFDKSYRTQASQKFKYKNIKIYMDGLYLYEKMNDYIDEVLGIL